VGDVGGVGAAEGGSGMSAGSRGAGVLGGEDIDISGRERGGTGTSHTPAVLGKPSSRRGRQLGDKVPATAPTVAVATRGPAGGSRVGEGSEAPMCKSGSEMHALLGTSQADGASSTAFESGMTS
jgi:hypothetical protein